MVKYSFFIFLIFTLNLFPEVQVKAYFSHEKVGTEDIVDFSIEIEGEAGNIETPIIPQKDFKILSGPSTSTSITVINFQMKKSSTYTWKLYPLREGKLTMPSIEVKIGGEIYKTQPETIEVEKGSLIGRSSKRQVFPFDEYFEEPKPRKMGGEVKIQRIPSKTDAYVGEPITINYNLLTQIQIQDISILEPPVYDSFWVENLKLPEKLEGKNVEIDGKPFLLYTIKRDLIIPNSEGMKRINEVTFQIQGITSRDFFGFPYIEKIIRKTEPLFINVKNLPKEGLPPNFSGGVGKFDLSLKTDKIEVEEGEAFSLILKLKGKGNFKSIKEISLPELPLCKIYPPKIEEKLNITSEGYEGEKIWEWIIIPEEKHSLKIEPLTFSYFDPHKRDYITLKTSSINVFVKKGKKEKKVIFAEGKEIKEIGKDIGYIIVDGKNLKKKGNKKGKDYLLFLIPIIFNLSLFLYKKFKGREISEKKKYERMARNYWRDALKFLKEEKEEEFLKNMEFSIKAIVSGQPFITIEEVKDKISKIPEGEELLKFLNLLNEYRFNPFYKEEKKLQDIKEEGKIWLDKLKNY